MPTIVESTISQSGTPDYSTLQAWEDACPADLTAVDQVWKGVIQEADDAFTTTSGTLLSISGITTDSTRYVWLTVKDGSSFADHPDKQLTWDSSKGASLSVTTGRCISNGLAHTLVERIQCRSVGGTVNFTVANSINSSNSTYKNILIESDCDNCATCGGDQNRWINVVIIQDGESNNSLMDTAVSTKTTHFHNCTFLAASDLTTPPTYIIDSVASHTNNFTNCAFYGASNLVDAGTNNYTTCATDLGSPPTGVTQISLANAAFVGTTVASTNLRIKDTSDLIDAGTEDATYSSLDIFGQTRDIYDIGAYESSADPLGQNKMMLLGVGGGG